MSLRRGLGVLPRALRAMALAFLLAGLPQAGAETLLVAVDERLDGEAASLPRPITEGLLEALFEADQIAFDLPPGPIPESTELRRVARETGASLILLLSADCRTLGAVENVSRLGVAVKLTLLDAASGAELARGDLSADNTGRERDVDLPALGREVGLQAVAALAAALEPTARAP